MDLALFDFDGTITVRDTLPAFVRRAAPRWRRLPGGLLLAPWVMGYRSGRLSPTRVRAAVARVAFTGTLAGPVDNAGAAFARDVLPALVRPAALARIAWHRDRGDRLVLVSGGFDLYLAPWAAAHGMAVLCSSLERRGGRLTGRYAGPQCVGEEKARRVRDAFDLHAYTCIHAYGDTHEDAALLALAHEVHYRRMPAPGERGGAWRAVAPHVA